jgi:ATPases involved in chromosome partitioning
LTIVSLEADSESETPTTMPRRILFTSQKGGVGKSTLARSAAVALAYAGRKVLLADF